jgi:hypothetical protein
MTLGQQATRIRKLAKVDKALAQLEYDIAARSVASSRQAAYLKTVAIECGLSTRISFL